VAVVILLVVLVVVLVVSSVVLVVTLVALACPKSGTRHTGEPEASQLQELEPVPAQEDGGEGRRKVAAA